MKQRVWGAARALLVTSILVGAAPAPAAHASDIGVCPEANTYYFAPGLAAFHQVGTADLHYSVFCQKVRVTTNPVGISFPTGGGSGLVRYSYSGTCAFATLGNNAAYTGFIVGSAVTITYGTPNGWMYGKVGLLAPNAPCNVTSAAGVEVSNYVAL